MRLILSGVVFVCLLAGSSPLRAVEEPTPEVRVAKVEKQVASMNGVLKRLLKEVAKAREENDLKRLNCLLIKLNLVKGLIKASEQAKGVLMEASYGGDRKTADAYATKIEAYEQSVREVEQSIDECLEVEGRSEEGTTLVYIRPEGEADISAAEPKSPFDMGEAAGTQGYPTVPPASPYR